MVWAKKRGGGGHGKLSRNPSRPGFAFPGYNRQLSTSSSEGSREMVAAEIGRDWKVLSSWPRDRDPFTGPGVGRLVPAITQGHGPVLSPGSQADLGRSLYKGLWATFHPTLSPRKPSPAWTPRHSLAEAVDAACQVLGHGSALHRLDTYLLQGLGEPAGHRAE